MPEIRMNYLKSLAMNCGPLSEMIHGLAPGYSSLARSRTISMSASVIDSRIMNQETAAGLARDEADDEAIADGFQKGLPSAGVVPIHPHTTVRWD
jgi:hypothetical protein